MKNEIEKFKEKYQPYFFTVITFLVVIFIFLQIDLPQVNTLFESYQSYKQISDKVSDLKIKSNMLSDLNEAELKQNYQQLNSILPEGKDAPGILRTFEVNASASGVSISGLDLSPGVLASQSSKENIMPVKISALGSFEAIKNFTSGILNLGRILSIESLEISFEGISTASGTARYELKVYSFSPAIDKISSETKLPELEPIMQENFTRALKRIIPPSGLIPSENPKGDLFK